MLRVLLALTVTIALGLLSRLRPVGWPLYDKSLGDVLYAVAVYLALALLLSRSRPIRVACLALAWCLAVEFFQATGIPARYAHVPGVRWLLGTTFSWHDIVCYIVGVTSIAGVDAQLLRPEQGATNHSPAPSYGPTERPSSAGSHSDASAESDAPRPQD